MLLIDRAENHGPIFKAVMENRLTVFVLGHASGRRVLKEHAAALQPVSIQVETLFPKGFMRQMAGESHRNYRHLLIQGIKALDFTAMAPHFESIILQHLETYTKNYETNQNDRFWSTRLFEITTGLLIYLFFGARAGSPFHDHLAAAYRNLGPHGVVWRITDKQVRAFEVLRAELRSRPRTDDASTEIGLLERVSAVGEVDETMLGNLIYMVELGRYDLRGLLRWVSRYAAEQPEWLDRIAADPPREPGRAGPVAEAFVLEVLRLEQSERLMRNVLRDFVFDGFLIPKGAMLRVCMWENHKDHKSFKDPFEFNPPRFLDEQNPDDGFSPFGLDHHHCPFSSTSVRLATIFLHLLARTYSITARGSTQAVRGPYHWEPAPGFSVELKPHRSSIA